jgi:ABC-type transport system involved in cytochrome c biogenesis permease component
MVSAVVVPLFLPLLLFSSYATRIGSAAGPDELNFVAVATISLKAKAVCEGPRGKLHICIMHIVHFEQS